MQRFDIQPVLSSALPDVASFLRRWKTNRDAESSITRPFPDDPLSIERRLRWLLVENPLATGVSQHGFSIRDSSGVIRGLLLSFPAAFLAADQRLLGLCSGNFFVEPQARTLGFYLFKRYLRSSGYSFFFATTCNANSAPVWKTVGACADPQSETEYILPLKLDVMLPALLSARNSSRLAATMARLIGRCANPVLRLHAQKSLKLTVEPCRDWERLSELFRRHRFAHRVTTDRSAVFLQWRYAQNSPNHPADICLFRDKRGNEGWFSLGKIVRGRRGQIRGRVLLDVIWPHDKMRFKDIFPTIVRRADAGTDAIFFRPRPGVDYGECSPSIIRRRLDAPQIFVFVPKGGASLAVSSLDLVPADGDSSFWI
jgi:hypothetical protein